MSKYAQAAIDTVRKNQGKSSLDMRQEWDKTMMEYFPTQKPSRVKGCPRNAFLGLSEEGLIIGIPAGDYGVRKGNVNKQYAVDAVTLLKAGDEPDKKQLWAVVADAKKALNHQMDIVLALLREGMLNI